MPVERFRLDGRRAVITGASRGIGQALALGFAEAGAEVALLARSPEGLKATADQVRALGAKALPIQADLAKPDDIKAAFGRIAEVWGGLDILVNNAGTNIRRPFVETTDGEWSQVLKTNLDAAFYASRAAARLMQLEAESEESERVEHGHRRILNIGSVAGLVALPTGVAYATSKAALSGFTRTLALELGPSGITVNCLAPWYFRTPLTEQLLDDPDYLARVLAVTPLGRIGHLDDLVAAALFLCSDAGAYITGQTLAIDGGMSICGLPPVT